MIKLNPLDGIERQILKDIASSKTGKVLISGINYPIKETIFSNKSYIYSRYEEYFNLRNNLENITIHKITKALEKSISHCYDSPTASLSIMKKKIIENQPNQLGMICQMCGINNADTFDHYIPKSKMAEFSIYPQNLIPICSECNRKKGDYWSNQREFINLYYDFIPNILILKCDFKVIDVPIPTFRFRDNWKSLLCKTHTAVQIKMIESHYKNLNLLSRFDIVCSSRLSEYINDYKIFGGNFEKYQNHLKYKLQDYINKNGINNWVSVLIFGMLESKELLEYIEKTYSEFEL